MSGTVVIAGYGPGISHAIALKYGKEKGHQLALICRTQSKLDGAVKEFEAIGVKALGFAVDLANTEAVIRALEEVKKKFGDVYILFWNGGGFPKPLLEMTSEDLHSNITINVDSLLASTKFLQKDLETMKGSVLVTGGGFADQSEVMTQMALDYSSATFALAKSSQRKLVHLLHLTLKPLGIFVGEVTVRVILKGNPWDYEGKATRTSEEVAEAFGKLLEDRKDPFVDFS